MIVAFEHRSSSTRSSEPLQITSRTRSSRVLIPLGLLIPLHVRYIASIKSHVFCVLPGREAMILRSAATYKDHHENTTKARRAEATSCRQRDRQENIETTVERGTVHDPERLSISEGHTDSASMTSHALSTARSLEPKVSQFPRLLAVKEPAMVQAWTIRPASAKGPLLAYRSVSMERSVPC